RPRRGCPWSLVLPRLLPVPDPVLPVLLLRDRRDLTGSRPMGRATSRTRFLERGRPEALRGAREGVARSAARGGAAGAAGGGADPRLIPPARRRPPRVP